MVVSLWQRNLYSMSFICLNRACCDWSRSHGICLVFEPDICLQLNKPDSCYSRDSFMPIFRLFLGQFWTSLFGYVIWRAGNSLIHSWLIPSFTHFAQIKWATVSDSLKSLKTNEWPWANRSGCSRQMSDCERIAHDKWATVRDLLRLLMINERMSALLKKFWQKNLKTYFLVCFINVFLLKKWVMRSYPLFWWAAHHKWAMWANRSGRSP